MGSNAIMMMSDLIVKRVLNEAKLRDFPKEKKEQREGYSALV